MWETLPSLALSRRWGCEIGRRMLGATRCILHDVQRAWGDDLGMIHAALAIIVRHVPCTDVMSCCIRSIVTWGWAMCRRCIRVLCTQNFQNRIRPRSNPCPIKARISKLIARAGGGGAYAADCGCDSRVQVAQSRQEARGSDRPRCLASVHPNAGTPVRLPRALQWSMQAAASPAGTRTPQRHAARHLCSQAPCSCCCCRGELTNCTRPPLAWLGTRQAVRRCGWR